MRPAGRAGRARAEGGRWSRRAVVRSSASALRLPPSALRLPPSAYNVPMPVRLGSDLLLESGALRGRRVGVVCNPASIDGAFRHIVDRLAAAPALTLAAIFGPQHGFRSDVQDNMIETPHAERPAAPRAGVLALQRDARADGRDARRPRRARHRPAGRRRAHLHLHLHDGQLPARRGAARRAGHRVRPAQPDRRRRRRRADARAAATSRSSGCSRSRCATG